MKIHTGKQIARLLTICSFSFLLINSSSAQIFREQTGIPLTGVSNSSVAWGDYNNDGYLDVLITGYDGSMPISKIYKNNGDESFTEQTSINLPGVYNSSVAWGDYNNDGYLDILLTGFNGSTAISKIYKNNGDNSFSEQTKIQLTGISSGSVAWGDYNNDGYQDILLTGAFGNAYYSKIYKNNGDGSFTELANTTLAEVAGSSVAWGDYNNDGNLDILLTGYCLSTSSYISKIYKNNGNDSFTEQTGIMLTGVGNSSVAWGDYNNDGYLDFILTGFSNSGLSVSKIYKNNGNGSFTEQTGIYLKEVTNSSVAWGDFNNDGLLDLLISGTYGTTNFSAIYKNNGDETFTQQLGTSWSMVSSGSSSWADYNNDGKLDVLLTGWTGSKAISKIFKNYATNNINTTPTAPLNLQQTINLCNVSLKWDQASDYPNDQNGLSYNIRVGTSPKGNDIVSPMALNTNGFRLKPTLGIINNKQGYILKNLPNGTYYWSVQAIDNTFAGGAWSSESSFIINAIQASNISSENINSNNIKLKWIKGNCNNRIVLMAEGNKSLDALIDNKLYSASTIFGSGTQVGSSGWYCVYNGSGDSVSVSGFKYGTTYSVRVLEYSGTSGNESYNTSKSTGNPISLLTRPTIEEQSGIPLSGVSWSSSAWGDYNNDGYLDILLTGDNGSSYISKIYKNNGDGSFTEQSSISLTGVCKGSVAWGDYNNDGYLDILLTGYTGSKAVSKIYKNNGDGTFTEQPDIDLTGVYYSSVAWGDYNTDGHLDILLTGTTGLTPISKIYKNNGDGTFSEQAETPLTGVYYSSVKWGDFNNDGYLDILLTGYNNGSIVTKIYKNNRYGSFTEQTDISLPGVYAGSVDMGDYNNDGFLDILITGYNGTAPISKIYKNNGNESFSELTNLTLHGVDWSSVAWGDFNNDGYSDFLLSGYNGSSAISKIYTNNGDETFTEQTMSILTGIYNSSVSWGDYNCDGYLDILITGNTGSSSISKIYKNVGMYNTNTIPTAPSNPTQSINLYNATLKWNNASDNQINPEGLNYNIRVGSTPGGFDIVSPMSFLNNGVRQISAPGNIRPGIGYELKNLPNGTFYWSVQAIDNSFAGGAWSNETSFTINTMQASNLTASDITAKTLKLSWNNGNGERRIVLMSKDNNSLDSIVDNISYFANPTFGEGEQIGSSGWYCVYNGSGSETNIYGLQDSTNYCAVVLDYCGSNGKETYNTRTSESNVKYIKTKYRFQEQSNISLPGVWSGSCAWGDYNKDGYLDILLTGSNISKLYKNNGDGSFTEQTDINLAGVRNSAVAWGDYNNDGFLDILMTGYKEASPVSKIYKNNGDGTFTEQTDIVLTGVADGSVAWGDYNNDGAQDILIAGNTGSNAISKIYKNNGDGSFSDQTNISLKGVSNCAVAWGDYNNDGYLDILLTGYTGSNPISIIYKNNGDGSFSVQPEIILPGVFYSSAAWGDFDNDGYLDILLTGNTGYSTISKVFKNNGDGSFSEQKDIQLSGVDNGSVAWGDFNHDGYLDILLTGYNGVKPVSEIYENNGDGSFTLQWGIALKGIEHSSCAWGDYNNDGYLDILNTGSYTTEIYKNTGFGLINTPPTAPTNLQQTVNGNSVSLSWDKAMDSQNSSNGLNYNLRVGTFSGGCNIISPIAFTTNGFRLKPTLGNVSQKTNGYVLKNLKKAGTYYWSVQAIDNSFAGGEWATESIFTIDSISVDSLYNTKKYTIFPNPTHDYFLVKQENSGVCFLEITDMEGRLVLTKKLENQYERIDISSLKNGLYIVRLRTEKENQLRKLMVR
jgi:FG-GAP repeat.